VAAQWELSGAMTGDIHFSCTLCGKCCSNLKIPLTALESVEWLRRGHPVQLICEATPWPVEFPADDQKSAHRRRRSFAAVSGSMPIRVVVILAARIDGACPNLLPDRRCGIYQRRPLVCKIYPAEINPFVRLEPRNKACPAEAWAAHHPLLQRKGVVGDEAVRRDIQSSRDTDEMDTGVKLRLCKALDVSDTALAAEGFVVYSPAIAALLGALSQAMAAADAAPDLNPWRFLSNQSGTVDSLLEGGALAALGSVPELPDGLAPVHEYIGFKAATPVA
jgi:Fe-S-cluster containining protein